MINRKPKVKPSQSEHQVVANRKSRRRKSKVQPG